MGLDDKEEKEEKQGMGWHCLLAGGSGMLWGSRLRVLELIMCFSGGDGGAYAAFD